MIESEDLIILDGMYSLLSKITGEVKDGALKAALGWKIIKPLIDIIKAWKDIPEIKKELVYYNGYIINRINNEEAKVEQI